MELTAGSAMQAVSLPALPAANSLTWGGGQAQCLEEEGNTQEWTCYVAHHLFEEFVESNERKYCLQKSMSPKQKNYLLSVMQCMGLKIKYAKNEEAYIYKSSTVVPFVRMLIASSETIQKMSQVGRMFRAKDFPRDNSFDHRPFAARTISSLTLGNPSVPKQPLSNAFRKHREFLPVFTYREEILNMINQNKFSVIKGPAGCGKSTQVPQYILEDAEARGYPVRILCCLPESICVLSVSDRVAMERGEKLGFTVGYQIPLESCSSPVDTLLNFVTGPILIRGMTVPGCLLLDTTTHIIIDEVHCRLRYQDFLLACLRDTAESYPSLKLIFMGEDLNIHFINEYFGGMNNCPEMVIGSEENLPPPKIYYLDDIIRFNWTSNDNSEYMYVPKLTVDVDDSQPTDDVDRMIENVFRKVEVEQSFADFLYLYRSGDISIDYTHSHTYMTMLMVSCAIGNLDFVKAALKCGANLQLRSRNGYTAMDWAVWKQAGEIITFLSGYVDLWEWERTKSCVLLDYLRHSDPVGVDLKLATRLVEFIHVTDTTNGGIIVFVPDYEDIYELQRMIRSKFKRDLNWGDQPLVIHPLHPYIQSGDQRAMFIEPKRGFRKIILSTSIGESSFTFDDISFVIDFGKSMYTKTLDSSTCLPSWDFKGHWISKAEADQRMTRARRGPQRVCYRLYTQECYEQMEEFIVPEITYCSLTNLSLQARALLESDAQISILFSLLPTPPSIHAVHDAINTLKLIGALDSQELLTTLGIHLMDYSIEPAWAKAVVYSVIFKCLDPILTIASCISYGNPFISRTHPRFRESFYSHKEKLSSETLSDHMALLKAFHTWESERALRASDNLEKFCVDNSISPWNFDIVYEIRARLLGQLRASGFVHNKGLYDVKSLNKYSDNYSLVRAVLISALYPNVCVANRISQTWFDRKSKGMTLAKSSVLSRENDLWQNLPTDWMVYGENMRDNKLNWCTLVNPVAIALFAGDLYYQPAATEWRAAPLVGGTGFVFRESDRNYCVTEMDKSCLDIDGWIRFFSFNMDSVDILPFRQRIRDMILQRLRQPQTYPCKMDERVLKILVEVLTEQDLKLGLKQASVGQWPKLVSGNLLSVPATGFEVSRW